MLLVVCIVMLSLGAGAALYVKERATGMWLVLLTEEVSSMLVRLGKRTGESILGQLLRDDVFCANSSPKSLPDAGLGLGRG